MTRKNPRLLATALLLGLALPGAHLTAGEPWGNDPGHNKVRPARNLPVEFSKDNLRWKIDTSTKWQFPMPTIVGGKVLIGSTHTMPDGFWKEAFERGSAFSCYDLDNGALLWRSFANNGRGYGVCGTPVVQGDRVYILAGYNIQCLDLDGLADGNDGFRQELEYITRHRGFSLPEGAEVPQKLPEWAADVIWQFDLSKHYPIKVQDATSCSVIEVADQIWVSTAFEIGTEARSDNPEKRPPRLVVLDKHTGKLIATDDIDVPIVFHGEWSSPSAVTVDGKTAVIFGDGYGVLHALAIPQADPEGKVVTLQKYWSYDMNPPEYRKLPDGRKIVYTLDLRLDYKYPKDYFTNTDEYFHFGQNKLSKEQIDELHWWDKPAQLAKGKHETVVGPCEIISIPAVVGNRIYLGIGRDRAYGLGEGKGRFLCLEMADVTQPPTIVWEDREIGRTQSTASIADGLVYIADGRGMLNCYDAKTGEVHYRYQLDEHAIKERSQIVADGKIYCGTERGVMKVLQAGTEPILLAESELRRPVATVEVADGIVVMAQHRSLMCYTNTASDQARTGN